MTDSSEPKPEAMFFLGAGASVEAGVPTTFGMIERFKEAISLPIGKLRALEKILEVLRENEIRQGRDGRVDVELLLDTLEKLEKRDNEVLLKFYETSNYLLRGYSEKTPLKQELKDFIKKCGIVRKEKITYLEPLLGFVAENKPVDVFSVNYDLCIEQLCDRYKKEYTDGFDNKWNPKLFDEREYDIRLYKLHGSIMWYLTDRADYVKLQTETQKNETRLITGERAATLILYPVRKWEYSGPLLELLILLKRKLELAKVVFVVGYSFRDEHIRRIFWDAARINRRLIVFLISPECNEIYQERLKDYAVPDLDVYFESGFEALDNGSQGFEKVATPSELKGRVVCLPYKFENVLPNLKNHYLKKLRNALSQEEQCIREELQGNKANWMECLKGFAECEYMQKVNEILTRNSWSEIKPENWNWRTGFEFCFIALLNCLASANLNEAKEWMNRIKEYTEKISVAKVFFNVSGVKMVADERVAEMSLKHPAEISLKFRIDGTILGALDLLPTIDKIVEATNRTIKQLGENAGQQIKKVKDRVISFQTYLQDWSRTQGTLILDEYIEKRKNSYERQTTELQEIYTASKRPTPPGAKPRAERIAEILKVIESTELNKIYGGSMLSFNMA